MNSINSSYNNNVNFTAKMDISEMGAHVKRMKNIAQMFEAKTKKYPDDTFHIGVCADGDYSIYHYDKGLEHENCADVTTESLNKLLEKSDEYVTKKLVKLFNIFKKVDEEYIRAGKYIVSVVKRDKNNDPTNFEQKFWDIVIKKANKDRDIAISKDAVLKNFDVY